MTDINTRRILDENKRLKRQVETQAENFERLRHCKEAAGRTVRAYERLYGPLTPNGTGRASQSGRKGQR